MTTYHQSTDRFSGACDRCVYPVVIETPDVPGDHQRVACPGCGAPVILERLYGSYSEAGCNSECQYALGPLCSCACGGANHQRGYIPPVFGGEVPAHVVDRYRRNVAKRKAAAAKAAETRAAKKEAKEALTRAAIKAEIDAWTADHGHILAWVDRNAIPGGVDGFAANLRWTLTRKGMLSPAQVEAVERSIERDRQRAAEEASARPAPIGPAVVVEGMVITVKDQPGYMPGSTEWKMLVKHADGWKVWATVPRQLSDMHWQDARDYGASRNLIDWLSGRRIRFTADLEASRKGDPLFVIGKRPRKAELVQDVEVAS